MKAFFTYFFGKGDEIEFNNFSLAHFLPIGILFLTIFLLYKFRKQIGNYKHEEKIRLILAFVLIITEMSYFWRLVGVPSLNPNPIDHLPITICGWAIIFCSYLLVSKSQSLFDIAYFWVFAGTIFALITPTVISYTGPTRFRYYQFWLEHTLGYIAIFYMIFVHKFRPVPKSIVKSYISLAVMAVIAYMSNEMLGPGANYLFMARPESTPSILDILPKNLAVRLSIMALVVSFMFFLSYLPWLIMDVVKKKKAKHSSTASEV